MVTETTAPGVVITVPVDESTAVAVAPVPSPSIVTVGAIV